MSASAASESKSQVRGWEPFLSDRDRSVFSNTRFGRQRSLGARPAVLVIDMTNGFCGDRPEPVIKSMSRYPTSCGQEAWDALPNVNQLCGAARQLGFPVLLTRGASRRADDVGRGLWPRRSQGTSDDPGDADELVAGLDVHRSDIVIEKTKPSAFHGTALIDLLIELRVDSLVVCGTTTSGCVRASVVDAFSYNFPVLVAEDATVDRGQASHWIGLFDLEMKYASVLPTARILGRLRAAGETFSARVRG